jgi:4-amino-4-deoxy-L-arabinose transferase-like glycosyltransferase
MIGPARAGAPILAVVLLGAALRFAALGFGLPHPQARPDETTALGHADAIVHGVLNPRFFNWPTFTLYLFAGVFAAAKTAGVALTRTREFLLARGVVALAGTATIPVTAAIARRVADPTTGLVAAVCLAVGALPVRESHFAMTDTLMVLLAMIAIALTMRAREHGGRPDFAWAGLAGGLATSTKYSAGVVVVLALAAPSLAAAAVFVAASAVGFLAGTPFALLDVREFLGDVAYERAHLAGGHAVLLARGWIYHPLVTLPNGMGTAVAIAAACGLPLAFVLYGRRAIVPAIFGAAFYLSIGSGQTVFFRYALPLVPLASVAAAIALVTLARWLAARTSIGEPAMVALVTAAVALPSLLQSVHLVRLLGRTDARVVAEEWLAARLHHDDTLYDSGGNYSRLWFENVDFHEWHYDAGSRSFGDPAGRTPEWIVLYESPLPEYSAPPASIRELVGERYEFAYRVDGVPAQAGTGVYDRQDAFFLPIAGFTGVARPGPTVLLYRLRSPSR